MPSTVNCALESDGRHSDYFSGLQLHAFINVSSFMTRFWLTNNAAMLFRSVVKVVLCTGYINN